uniref:Uncharacterized protein n=1 Tax=Tetraselmis sp. GSL018 TaxID=582737 RepID=A0A061SIY5_9CHLO
MSAKQDKRCVRNQTLAENTIHKAAKGMFSETLKKKKFLNFIQIPVYREKAGQTESQTIFRRAIKGHEVKGTGKEMYANR